MPKAKQPDKHKAKRGRPKKEQPAEEPKAPEKPVYSHESNMRCPKNNKAYPAMLRVKCGEPMKAVKTIQQGSIKVWKCPKCERLTRTEGKLI